MNAKIKKTLVASLAAVTVAGGLVASSAPAQAGGPNPWVMGGAGFVGGLMIGSLAARQPAYYNCGRVRQRVYDDYGYFVGYRWVSAC